MFAPLRGASENFDASDVPEFTATGDMSMAIDQVRRWICAAPQAKCAELTLATCSVW